MPRGEVGEVVVRGPNVMAGLLEQARRDRHALHAGWYRTGDLGYLDEQSYLFLVDRAKDMIVSGGENVYSVEVENAFTATRRSLEAAVFGMPDERWGRRSHAVVVVARSEVTAEELREPLPRADRRLQGAEGIDLRTDAAAQVRSRQDPEARAAGALLGGTRPQHRLAGTARGPLAAARDAVVEGPRGGADECRRSR